MGDLSLNLKQTDLMRLAGQKAPGTLLFLAPERHSWLFMCPSACAPSLWPPGLPPLPCYCLFVQFLSLSPPSPPCRSAHRFLLCTPRHPIHRTSPFNYCTFPFKNFHLTLCIFYFFTKTIFFMCFQQQNTFFCGICFYLVLTAVFKTGK